MAGKDLVPRPAAQPPAAVEQPPWQQRARGSEAAYRTIGKWARRNRHVTVPLAVPLVLWPAGLILYHYHAAGFVLGTGLLVTLLIGFFAPSKWDRPAERWYACASAVVLVLWLWLAAWTGPLRGFITGIVLASLLAAFAVAWGIPWWRHKRPRGRRRREKRVAKWDAWWQSHCWHWNLGGSRVIDVHEMHVTTKVRVQGMPGKHSIAYVRQVLHLIESGTEGLADAGMVRAEPVKGNASQFDLFFKRENPLAKAAEYDLTLTPSSVNETAPAGIAETGAVKSIVQRANKFVIGMTQWGKSNLLSVLLAALTGCPDSRQILIDIGGGRSSRPWLPALDYVATDIDEARMVLRFLNDEVQGRRKRAYFGEESLTPTPDVPAIHLIIDEAHAVTSVPNGDAECARLVALIASQGNAVAVYTEVYTQYGSLEESVRTEQTRSNLPVRVCFRVAEPRHGAFAIPEYAKLDASKLEEVGSCYVKDGPETSPEQVRTYHLPHKMVRRIAGQKDHAALRRPPLRLYAEQWQEWWDARWSRLDPEFRAECPQHQAYAAMLAAESPAESHAAMRQIRAEAEDHAQPSPAPGEGDGRSAAGQIDGELEQAHRGIPDGFRPSPGVVAGMRTVTRQQKDAFADALAAAPPAHGISPAQLREESGMGRTWIHQMLAALAEADAVTQLRRGLYAPLPGADIHAAVELVEAGNDQLLREGRRRLQSVR
jgi:hypothetical protein